MYHSINALADEERLLEQKLALQSSIREKRERMRRKRTHDTEVYSKMFEPVTKSIAKLIPTANSGPTAAAAAIKQEPAGFKQEEEGEEEEEEEEPAEPLEPAEQQPMPELEPDDQPVPIPIKEEDDGPDDDLYEEALGDLYQEALVSIPQKFRDDGQLGLCPRTHQIGAYTYAVQGNTLQAVSNHDENEEVHQFEIHNVNLWKLLLVFNPTNIGLKLTRSAEQAASAAAAAGGSKSKVKFLPFVTHYVHIARKLNLLDTFTGSKNRVKYVLLTQNHWGSGLGSRGRGGFLFTSNPPLPTTPSKVIVLPPDNQGLMSQLYRAVAEFHAGNTTMRNLIVPMVREARRRHIRIPPALLEEPEDDTWVLA